MPKWLADIRTYFKSVIWRWFNLFAGVVVTTIWAFYLQLTGKALPMIAFWSLVVACVLIATFLAWRDEYQKAKARETEREKAIRECFNRAAQKLKGVTVEELFPGFYKAEPYNLESNDEVIKVCDLLTQHGHTHPFGRIDGHVLKNEWWEFLKWGHAYNKVHFDKGMQYIAAAREWNNEKKKRPNKAFDLQTDVWPKRTLKEN
jgi:hypothetical protein